MKEELRNTRVDVKSVFGEQFRINDQLDYLNQMIDDLQIEIEDQFNNEVNRNDFKIILRGIKTVIIDQLRKGRNKRAWKGWEKNALQQTTYQANWDAFEAYYGGDWNGRGAANYPLQNYQKESYKGSNLPATTTRYTKRPNKVLKWELVITEEVGVFIKQMMALNKNCEWGVAFTWIKNELTKQLIIDRVYIMPVDQGGAHVEFINESEYMIFADISELGEFVTDIDNKTRFAGIMHSHHNMGSWHSSIDHNTIETYINDFKQVLSIVWAWNGDDKPITADIILQNEKDSYTLDKISFENEVSSNDEKVMEIDNHYSTRYISMIDTVASQLPKYKKLMKIFEGTKKFNSIQKIHEILINEENNCENIEPFRKVLSL